MRCRAGRPSEEVGMHANKAYFSFFSPFPFTQHGIKHFFDMLANNREGKGGKETADR